MESTTKTPSRREIIDNFLNEESRITSLPKSEIEEELLFFVIMQIKAKHAKAAEYPEYNGVKGGCGHTSKEIAEDGAGCGIIILIFVLGIIGMILFYVLDKCGIM